MVSQINRTPAFAFDISSLLEKSKRLKKLSLRCGNKILYPLKALTCDSVVSSIAGQVEGLAVSSLFEARLAHDVQLSRGTIHFTSPSLRTADIDEICEICDYISFNSLPQLARFRTAMEDSVRFGIRVNPQLSFIDDLRYNPSRPASKLGVPLTDLVAVLSDGARNTLDGVSGIHFHNNTDSTVFSELLQTVEHLDMHLGSWLSRLEWINLGGGYLFPEDVNLQPFYQAVDLLKSKHGLEVFIEPGAALVRDAGFIVSSVVDIFKSEGKQIAVLDTTVNHMPEVFEYQFEPDVEGHVENGPYPYLLAGASCLAGDVFGEYAFEEPLEIGSRVVFTGMGAYTLVKANMFNGINLPSIYSLREDGELVLEKQFTYEDFALRCGVEVHDLK